MTLNTTNSPNLLLIARTWARIEAERVGGEVEEVRTVEKGEEDGGIETLPILRRGCGLGKV